MTLIAQAARAMRMGIGAVVLVSFTALATDTSTLNNQIDHLYQAFLRGKPSPVISHTMASFTLPDAYYVQRGYVQKRLAGDSIRGFKGGLTTPQSQKQFGLSEPVVGVLLASGEISPLADGSALVNAAEFHRLMIETEVGFVFDKPITSVLASVDELKKHVRHVLPAVELPDLGFSDSAHLRGLDVVANDVGAKRFLLGKSQERSQSLNDISVELRCNDRPLNVGKATELMGSPWQAALWEVNKLVNVGYKIEAGQVLITGAMGRAIPAVPGKCVADFGAFGKIAFEVKSIASKQSSAPTR